MNSDETIVFLNDRFVPASQASINIYDLGIVHFVTAGENPIYAGSAAGNVRLQPTVCIHSFPLPFAAWSERVGVDIIAQVLAAPPLA